MQNLILNQLPCFSTYGVREQLNFLFSRHCYCSVTKSCPTLCYSMHSGLPWPSLSPTICSNSCPLNQWCYLTIFSSATRFSLCLQSLPASGSFPVSQFFETGWQSIEVSVSASVLPMNIQGWFPLGLTTLISLLSKD